ncbi:MAG: LysR family transcriptional regulator [Pseudomonadota bacterium]
MKYTLRQLQVFLATARHENITRAAGELAMSQSAASGSLSELETQFGVKLFDRIGKRLRLSELGRQLRPDAQRLLDQAKEFERALAGGDIQGRVRAGATLTIGNYIAVGMIAAFMKRYPEADIQLSVANTEQIAERVATFQLDAGMIEGELRHPDLDIQHWRGDELVAFAAPDHPAAHQSIQQDGDLLRCNWIVREPGSGTRQAFDRAMQGILTDLRITLELQHTEAIKRAVSAGLGVGCLSRICLTEAFERGTLVPLNIPGRDFRRDWYLITHRQKYHGAALREWLALCKETQEPLR